MCQALCWGFHALDPGPYFTLLIFLRGERREEDVLIDQCGWVDAEAGVTF